MPWLSIIMALLTFFTSKRNGASSTKAALMAGLVGAGTYYVTHETDWGKANLGQFDGVPKPSTVPLLKPDGSPVLDADGQPVNSPSSGSTSGFSDVLKSWGATGTAAVLGAGAAATGTGIFSSKNLPWLIAGGALIIFIMKG